jgi:hypothetical protein
MKPDMYTGFCQEKKVMQDSSSPKHDESAEDEGSTIKSPLYA